MFVGQSRESTRLAEPDPLHKGIDLPRLQVVAGCSLDRLAVVIGLTTVCVEKVNLEANPNAKDFSKRL